MTLQEEAKNLKIDEKFMKVLVLFLYMLSQQLAKKSMATMSLSLSFRFYLLCVEIIYHPVAPFLRTCIRYCRLPEEKGENIHLDDNYVLKR